MAIDVTAPDVSLASWLADMAGERLLAVRAESSGLSPAQLKDPGDTEFISPVRDERRRAREFVADCEFCAVHIDTTVLQPEQAADPIINRLREMGVIR